MLLPESSLSSLFMHMNMLNMWCGRTNYTLPFFCFFLVFILCSEATVVNSILLLYFPHICTNSLWFYQRVVGSSFNGFGSLELVVRGSISGSCRLWRIRGWEKSVFQCRLVPRRRISLPQLQARYPEKPKKLSLILVFNK